MRVLARRGKRVARQRVYDVGSSIDKQHHRSPVGKLFFAIMIMCSTWFRVTTLMAFAMLCCGQVSLDYSGERGRVRILVLDPFGHPLDAAQLFIEAVDAQRKTAFAQTQKDLVLDYGEYRIRVAHPGFHTVLHTFKIATPESIIVLALPIGEIESPSEQSSVTGQVHDFDTARSCDTVRLVPIFLSSPPVEAPVSTTGYFSFDNVSAGSYVAVLIGRSGVCRISTIMIQKRRTQQLVLN